MNYYELTFTYTSPVETSIINDVLAAELGEIGFESFAENENGLQGYISDQLYNVKGLQDKLAEFPLENVDIHFTETLVESKDWNEEWVGGIPPADSSSGSRGRGTPSPFWPVSNPRVACTETAPACVPAGGGAGLKSACGCSPSSSPRQSYA